jgi:HSP20 family protein
MEERTDLQSVPVKVYRTPELVTVAAPMPGLEPEDIAVEVTPGGALMLRGRLRGALKDAKELLVDEWSVGPYHREITLPAPVDGEGATLTYGNGVLVVALPVAAETRPALLSLREIGPARGERVPEAIAGEHRHAGKPR